MPENKYFKPFVIQLRQYMPNPGGTGFVFYKDEPFSFDYAAEYGQEVKLETPLGFFIASLAAPNVASISDLIEMGQTLEKRSTIVYPGSTDDITNNLSQSFDRPYRLDLMATFHDVRGSGKPIQLRAIFTDRPELVKRLSSIPARV